MGVVSRHEASVPSSRRVNSTVVLSAFYFGSVEHYRVLAKEERVVLDAGEHYERQSYRTRTTIIGPNGVQDLNVQILRRSGEKMPLHTVALSHAETWPQQHLHAIRSAYGQTPWFIHYIDEIERVLLGPYERLLDLDLATLRMGMRWLGLTTAIEVSTAYVEADGIRDLRRSLHPKLSLPDGLPAPRPYPQVFADRHGFVPRLSVIDLVMNTGPEAARLLRI